MKKIYLIIVFASLVLGAKSQQVNTLYFLDNAPMRHYINPAYQPLSDAYVSLPIIGYTDLWVGNNSISIKDLLYKNNAGQTISFLHPTGDKNKFLDAMRPTLNLDLVSRINLLSFGWRWNNAYWHVDMNLRANGNVGISKDLFSFALMGMDDIQQNQHVNLDKLGMNIDAYAEFGLGYSHRINDQVTVGGKAKFLYGLAHASMQNKHLGLNASIDTWNFEGEGAGYVSGNFIDYPASISDFSQFAVNTSKPWQELIKPAGLGFAVDLGVTYNPLEMLTLSLGVNDLGFINWKGRKYNYAVKGEYDGLGDVSFDDLQSDALTDTILNRLTEDFSHSFQDKGTEDKYRFMVSPRLYAGAEVNFWDDRVGLGVHSTTQFIVDKIQQEVTMGASFRPANWFNLAASYSIINGRFASMGGGLGLRGGPFSLTLMADYIPFSYAGYAMPSGSTIPLPYKTKGINLGFGFNFVFGNRQDRDRDGVVNRKDQCPETPRGVLVDQFGCPLDTDGDGVPDYIDQCLNTPAEAHGMVDSLGCPLDTDGDAVPDYLDRCPDTPQEAYGQVDQHGCPLDSDLDGVPDYIDQCLNTPFQAIGKIDSVGCPLDSDGDGVPDYIDRCAGTPKEAFGQIDEYGCPLDTDGDGVPNYIDKCQVTLPAAVQFVDEYGCDKDTDGDGVPDYKDACITTAGVASNNGCPEVKREVRSLFTKALQGISFSPGKAVIKSSSYGILNQIAKVLIDNPDYMVEIQGHTDDVGRAELNKVISNKRAQAVRSYLIRKGVSSERMTAVGYGEDKPVASNKTASGRYKNRRVEFVISFEQVTYE